MSLESIDSLLAFIDENIANVEQRNVDKLCEAINQFQQDSSLLVSGHDRRNRLPYYLQCLTHDLSAATNECILLRSKVFYNISKVVTWKKIVKYLPTNVYKLPQVVSILPDTGREKADDTWYISYMALSWIYMLVLSPFKLEESCGRLYHVTARYKRYQSLRAIVSHIHSQLFVKNVELFDSLKLQMDLPTLNCYLKVTQRPIDKFLVSFFTQQCFQGTDGDLIIRIKLLPKMFKQSAHHGNWDLMEDIISWFLDNMGNDFTNVRFTLAHSFAKIVNLLMHEVDEMEVAEGLIESRVKHTAKLLESRASWDLVDSALLHCNLLVLAELSAVIATNWPQLCDEIAVSIIPLASQFQQLSIKNIKGSHIKDASNFIGWSIARANKKGQVVNKKIMINVFLNLFMCSAFDRDLLVRMSANAALQEVLGRYMSPMKLLDNVTIVKIIELPITNLAESYLGNAILIYSIFSAKEEYNQYLDYFNYWLISINLLNNHDLHVVRMTIASIHGIILKYNLSLDTSIVSQLISCVKTVINHGDVLQSARILSLLIRLSQDDLLSSVASPENMNGLYQRLIETDKINHNAVECDMFRYSVILEFWNLRMAKSDDFTLDDRTIKMFFNLVRSIPEGEQYLRIFDPLVKRFISNVASPNFTWDTAVHSDTFWSTFQKYVRFNNSYACSALPKLTPRTFQAIFLSVLADLDCARKSQLIKSLSGQLSSIVDANGDSILYTIVNLLNDYTITQQGDVGRYVRISSAKAIAQNTSLFLGMQQKIRGSVILNLMRLCAEQVAELKIMCFKVLCKSFDYKIEIDKAKLNSQLLKFQQVHFNGNCVEFWKGYLKSAGAIHFIDSEITDAIDEFLKYYISLPEEQRLELCNCLVRVIPSAKEITNFQMGARRDKDTGIMKDDPLKISINHLNFWSRIMESGIQIDRKFNFRGVYAKLYNLHLLRNELLKITVLKLLPLLISTQTYSLGTIDKELVNTILKRLLTLLKREINCANKSPRMLETLFEAIAQIYIECNAMSQLEVIKSLSRNNDEIVEVAESMTVV